MAKYVRAKKYLRVFVPVLIVVGAILVPKVDHSPKGETLAASVRKPRANSLQVSTSGGQMYTNLTADNLQAASAPERSATPAALSPQQAAPNYCQPSEQPYIDGCVANN